MSPSIWQVLIVGVLVLILFGRGRISEMMGDVGKGIKSFKKGLNEEEAEQADKETPPSQIDSNVKSADGHKDKV